MQQGLSVPHCLPGYLASAVQKTGNCVLDIRVRQSNLKCTMRRCFATAVRSLARRQDDWTKEMSISHAVYVRASLPTPRNALSTRYHSVMPKTDDSKYDSQTIMPSIPQRPIDVTDGQWDEADKASVARALKDAAQIERLTLKHGAGKVILGRTLEELEELAREDGQPKYRGKQLRDGVLLGARNIGDISNIPRAWKTTLEEKGIKIGRSELYHQVKAKDGTRKFLLKLHDGYVVETVGIPVDDNVTSKNRLTVCVSSQVGCPMRCTFCATGKGGFARNLLPHEIVDQVLHVQESFGRRVSNVVFMGMGEPLLNLPSVMAAHRSLNQDLGIGARHITISTVGVPNAIRRMAEYDTQSTLAVSIHAPNQELRQSIVPSASSYPLLSLMKDCNEYFRITGRRVSFEYTLLGGVNDGIEHAEELAKLLRKYGGNGRSKGMRSHVNVIQWNPVDESDFQRPSKQRLQNFVEKLTENGIAASVRRTRGLEAAAACGQLRNRHQKVPLTP